MILLDDTDKTLEVELGAAVATELPWVATYADHTTTTFVPEAQDGETNGTALVVLVPAPAGSIQRQIKYLSFYNPNAAEVEVKVQYHHGASFRTVADINLQEGDNLEYVDGQGFHVTATNGAVRTVSTFEPHEIGGSAHIADTLANLNTKISDANLDDENDPRTPTAHASTHEDGNSDELDVTNLGGYPGGTVNFLRADATFAQPPGIGYTLSYGAQFGGGDTGDYARSNGYAGNATRGPLDPRAEHVAPWPGTLKALGYMTDGADATTIVKIVVNSVVEETITLTGATGSDTSLSTVIAAGDRIAVEYDAGTAPNRSTWQVYIE